MQSGRLLGCSASVQSNDSRSVTISVSDDWRTFALNNRRVAKDQHDESHTSNAHTRMLLEKQSMLDS
jgi:hypothetical protein